MNRKWIIISAGSFTVLLSIISFFATSTETTLANDTELNTDILRPVPTVIAKAGKTTVIRSFPGKVQAGRRVDLAFDVDGVLVELDAQEGSLVNEGDIIAKIDSRDLENNYKASNITCEDAERIYRRAEILRGKKIISQSEYDKAKANWKIAEAKKSVCKKNLDDSVLIAPFSGVIAARNVENYQRINEQQIIVSLQDITKEEVIIQLPESFIAHAGIESIRKIRVKFDVDESRWFKAELSEYRMQPDSYTRTYDAVISIDPPADLSILPGMTATVVIEQNNPAGDYTPNKQSRISIPIEAIWSNGHKKSFVWVIPEAGGYPRKSEVTIEKLIGKTAVITGGINDGDYIATAGVNSLTELVQVRPMIAGRKGLNG